MKKLVIAAAVSMMFAGGAYAQSYSNNENTGNDSIGANSFLDEINDSVISSSDFAYIGDDADRNFNLNIDFDSIVGSVTLAAAVNVADIDASISLTGSNVTISAASTTADANATAVGATSSATATSNAFSGSTFTTTAIGAFSSASIEMDASMVTNTTSFTSTDLGFIGEDLNVTGDNFSVDAFDDQADGQFAGNIATATSTVNGFTVANLAYNAGDIIASVSMVADYEPGNVFHAPSGGLINLTNLNITTTAIGAFNSGSIRLGSLVAPE